MTDALVFISGASSGIGQALAAAVPWEGARVIDVSRRGGVPGAEHVAADLADPATWTEVAAVFRREAASFGGEVVVFVHAAGTVEPIGYAGEVDTGAYARNAILNGAAPQVLGHAFLAAVRDLVARKHLVLLTSGAAKTPYPGWSSYGAGKAGVDQWVRAVGLEQAERGGAQVLAVAPGTVDTAMQAGLRAAGERDFPRRAKFTELHAAGKLTDPAEVASGIWSLLDRGLETGSVVDLRELTRTA